MITRTNKEIGEIRDRMNAGEKLGDIYKDMNSKIDVRKRMWMPSAKEKLLYGLI